MRFSDKAQGVSAGDKTPIDGSTDFSQNLTIDVSRANLIITNIAYFEPNGIFIVNIDNTTAQIGDTVKINLNQFQDSRGSVLSGELVLTYSNNPGSYGDTPTGWVASITE